MSIDIKRTIRHRVPNLQYEKIAPAILGDRYELSLVLCADELATRMNQTYRHKSYSPNVLSFAYSKSDGEIFLNIRKAGREAATLGVSTHARLALLFVHGCFHLAGYDHGRKMGAREKSILKKFGF